MPEIKPQDPRPLINGLLDNLGQKASAAVAEAINWDAYVQPTIDFIQACADRTFSTQSHLALTLHNHPEEMPVLLSISIMDEDRDDIITCENVDLAAALAQRHIHYNQDACEFEDTISQVEFLLIDLKRRFKEHYGQTVDKYRSENKDYGYPYIRT